MARQTTGLQDKELKIPTDIETLATEDVELAEKQIEISCEKGEFVFDGTKYQHEDLDLETAQMLIDKGYPYLKVK